jgi:hypothetical protein
MYVLYISYFEVQLYSTVHSTVLYCTVLQMCRHFPQCYATRCPQYTPINCSDPPTILGNLLCLAREISQSRVVVDVRVGSAGVSSVDATRQQHRHQRGPFQTGLGTPHFLSRHHHRRHHRQDCSRLSSQRRQQPTGQCAWTDLLPCTTFVQGLVAAVGRTSPLTPCRPRGGEEVQEA